LEKKDQRRRYYRARPLELQCRLQCWGGGGQGKNKKASNKTTDLTGAPTGLTGTQTGESGNSSTIRNRIRPSFKELLTKYEKEEAV